jgi:fibro-slime domain-containing protein
MKRVCLGVLAVFLLGSIAWADLTLHFQSPWRDDATRSDYVPHVLGGAGGDYNPHFDATSTTMMKADGNGWFTYTWVGKSLADFQEWMSFNIKGCPNTADYNYNQNNCVPWGSNEFRMGEFFGTETELWLYTKADGSYEKSFMAPGSKIVWFKSPWGNKSLPQMIFGADSVLMRFIPGEASKCGWFYGSVTPTMMSSNPVQSAYFIRYKSPWYAVPADSDAVIDLSVALAASDTIYVDGTSAAPEASLTMGTKGECFDPTRVLHVYHPWRSNTSYRDSAFYITIGNNILNQPTPLAADGKYKYWREISFDDTLVSSPKWNSTMAQVQLLRGQNEWPQHPYFEEADRPLASDLFPAGIYETWMFASTSLGVKDFVYYPLEPKVVRLLSPWDDMSPSMLIVSMDDTVKMGPLPLDRQKDTCGWYEGTYYKHTDEWKVYFKQTFGMEYYSMSGIVGENKPAGEAVYLDSVLKVRDTVWVHPYPVSSSAPLLDVAFPNHLGRCPEMKISAMVVDWAGESYPDNIDVDFGGIYNGNPYTTIWGMNQNGEMDSLKTCGGHVTGMVLPKLVNGLPARVDSLDYPWYQCSAAHEIEKWFVPQVVATDAAGKEYTNATCRDIDLTLDEEGFWLADFTNEDDCNDTINPGFYPVDDFEYLDSAKTVKNPKFDWNVNGCRHNYSFAMKISAQFQYIPGQYFEFRGDDDVWVFIDNRLAVDIGGCHSPVEGAVNLDTMGLEEGKIYPFHIFFSERNATGSNFKMRTSINLQTEKRYFPVEEPTSDGTIEYTILQILTEENLTCDISSVGKVDTTLAESVFILYGQNAVKDGETLKPGLNYGGINISENMAGFVIDTAAIVRARALPPGMYVLRFYLVADPSQSSEVYFEVPEYPLPDIAFADAAGEPFDPTGYNLLLERMGLPENNGSKDTLMAFVSYPVTIMVTYIGQVCADCIVTVDLSTTDSLSFLDANGQPITSVTTDSTGYATFYVMGYAAVNDASFTVSGGEVANKLVWGGINMMEPPVPYAGKGYMYDRDGDGIADSLYIPFSEPFDTDIPDTLAWSFGDSAWHVTTPVESVRSLIQNGSDIVITADNLVENVFTGGNKDVYQGGLHYHYTYWDEDKGDSISLSMNGTVEDRIGPVLLSAIVTPGKDKLTTLTLLLSEATLDTSLGAIDMFDFTIWRMGEEVSQQMVVPRMTRMQNGVRYDLYFYGDETAVLPAVGDSVRLMPGVIRDLNGNVPHIANPWVRIIGGQRLLVDVPGLVTLTEERAIETAQWESSVTPMAIPPEQSLKDAIEQTGLPGQMLNYDLQELGLTASDTVSIDSIRIVWNVSYFSTLGQFVNKAKGSIACSDPVIFNGDCRTNPAKVFLAWNGRSDKGRLVGTGAYISKLDWKVMAGHKAVGKRDDTFTMGVRRGK